MNRKYVNILGIKLSSTSKEGVIAYVKYRIEKKAKFYIVTPNPEIVLASNKDKVLKKTINQADLSLPDGVGLAQAAHFLSLKVPENIILRFIVSFLQGTIVGIATFFRKNWLTSSLNILPGREVFLDLISLANQNSWKVFLLGGYGGVSAKVIEKIKTKNKKIRFGFDDGPKLNKKGEPDTKVDTLIQKVSLDKINKFNPDLLFVALGPTKQEKWIAKNFPKLNIGGAMVVGGTFNYIAGVSKLPPVWMEQLGLEWVWRGLNEPWRFKRILNAFPIFPLKVFWYKVTGS